MPLNLTWMLSIYGTITGLVYVLWFFNFEWKTALLFVGGAYLLQIINFIIGYIVGVIYDKLENKNYPSYIIKNIGDNEPLQSSPRSSTN